MNFKRKDDIDRDTFSYVCDQRRSWSEARSQGYQLWTKRKTTAIALHNAVTDPVPKSECANNFFLNIVSFVLAVNWRRVLCFGVHVTFWLEDPVILADPASYQLPARLLSATTILCILVPSRVASMDISSILLLGAIGLRKSQCKRTTHSHSEDCLNPGLI